MVQWHLKSKRKVSGGIRTSKNNSDKKLALKGNEPTNTIVVNSTQKSKTSTVKGFGKTLKQRSNQATHAVLSTGSKAIKVPVTSVAENKANRLFTRRNIITKGALIRVLVDEKEQIAKVTSRPGQTGTINAVLIKEVK